MFIMQTFSMDSHFDVMQFFFHFTPDQASKKQNKKQREKHQVESSRCIEVQQSMENVNDEHERFIASKKKKKKDKH